MARVLLDLIQTPIYPANCASQANGVLQVPKLLVRTALVAIIQPLLWRLLTLHTLILQEGAL